MQQQVAGQLEPFLLEQQQLVKETMVIWFSLQLGKQENIQLLMMLMTMIYSAHSLEIFQKTKQFHLTKKSQLQMNLLLLDILSVTGQLLHLAKALEIDMRLINLIQIFLLRQATEHQSYFMQFGKFKTLI